MPHYPHREEDRRNWMREVREVASRLLAGHLGVIEGARTLAALGFESARDPDPDFTIFVAIASETAHLPIGAERKHWADSALVEKDIETSSLEDRNRGAAFAGCRALISKYPDDQPLLAVEPQTVTLYRPAGPKELELIRASGNREFPPRLPDQPIFYPVLTEEYAARIAREWNATKASTGYTGYITRFQVRAEHLSRYEVQNAGGSRYQEYWIPAEELPEFNANIVGFIEMIAEFQGPGADQERPPAES